MPIESTTEELIIRGLSHFEINRQYVEADLVWSDRQHVKVLASHPPQHSGLIVVDGRFRGRKAPAGSGLYFDKAENVFLPGHQVEIAADFSAMPAACDHHVAV